MLLVVVGGAQQKKNDCFRCILCELLVYVNKDKEVDG